MSIKIGLTENHGAYTPRGLRGLAHLNFPTSFVKKLADQDKQLGVIALRSANQKWYATHMVAGVETDRGLDVLAICAAEHHFDPRLRRRRWDMTVTESHTKGGKLVVYSIHPSASGTYFMKYEPVWGSSPSELAKLRPILDNPTATTPLVASISPKHAKTLKDIIGIDFYPGNGVVNTELYAVMPPESYTHWKQTIEECRYEVAQTLDVEVFEVTDKVQDNLYTFSGFTLERKNGIPVALESKYDSFEEMDAALQPDPRQYLLSARMAINLLKAGFEVGFTIDELVTIERQYGDMVPGKAYGLIGRAMKKYQQPRMVDSPPVPTAEIVEDDAPELSEEEHQEQPPTNVVLAGPSPEAAFLSSGDEGGYEEKLAA